MKVNIDELQVRRAKTSRSITAIENKYGNSINNVSRQAFGSPIQFDAANGIITVLHDGKPIATCIYVGRTIYNVCVDEEYRNNGVCHLLVKECISYMKNHLKGRTSYIQLSSHNPTAQKVYESLGFVYVEGEVEKYYRFEI